MFDSFFQWFEDKLAAATENGLRRGVERARSTPAPPAIEDKAEAPPVIAEEAGRNGRGKKNAAAA